MLSVVHTNLGLIDFQLDGYRALCIRLRRFVKVGSRMEWQALGQVFGTYRCRSVALLSLMIIGL